MSGYYKKLWERRSRVYQSHYTPTNFIKHKNS